MKHISQTDVEGYNLSKNRCECGTAHSHIQCKNEDWIKNCIYDGADQHGNHRITWASVGENQFTHTGVGNQKWESDRNDTRIFLCIWQDFCCCSEEFEHWCKQDGGKCE